MKAFLMYRDRDFDPQHILARRAREVRRGEGPKLEQLLPWNEQALRQDLGLDILLSAMAAKDIFLFEVAKVAVLSSLADVDTIRYRQSVLRDCLQHESIVREIYQLAIDAIEGERKHYLSFFVRYPSGILSRAVDVLERWVSAPTWR